ncbi:hypothetical protein [Polaromonas sp. AER18D-145]|uniref:hypothetical protein n=1 Tax=Polaromonas sp. AER18D-145 TaxID=1977060 RepID=UPI001143C180|nr:hypothetical protein [Polaromonas sp. AER18D-145]
MNLAPLFVPILFLLGWAAAIVLLFRHLRIPSNLGYLLVGLLLGPHIVGPVVGVPPVQALAEFGRAAQARALQMPISPARLWQWMQSGG